MKDRCYNAKSEEYPRYGERGITVCDRWLESFENFYADMGDKPSPELTLERVDNNAGYSPENCIWATEHQQKMNRRVTVYLTYDGVTKTLVEWCEEKDLDQPLVRSRIKQGWSVARAFYEPRYSRRS